MGARFVIGLLAVAAGRRGSLVLCCAAGLFAGAAYYIKPSVVGVAAGTAVFLALFFGDAAERRRRVLRRLAASTLFLAGGYAGLMLLPPLLGQPLHWIPQLAAGLYASELAQPTGGVAGTTAALLKYTSGHAAVLLLLFPTGIAGSVIAMRRGREDTEAPGGASALARLLARWLVCAAAASVVSVAYYSLKIEPNDSLGVRLHGRYFAFVLPFLLLFSIWFHHQVQGDAAKVRRMPLMIALVALLIGGGAWLARVGAGRIQDLSVGLSRTERVILRDQWLLA